MIIKKLTLYNYGVYAGLNTFEFASDKPIVLIGGMNGRGKTTFLSAILLALYGKNSFAFKESKETSYNKYLRSFVNKGNIDQNTYIELEFEIREQAWDRYIVRREWNARQKVTKEKITVRKNGVINELLSNNWAMFVEGIIPNALSGFYFFDGEKIAEMAVDENNQQLKDSIRAMLGVTSLDVLKNDLNRNISSATKKKSGNNNLSELEELRNTRDQAVKQLASIDESINAVFEKIENTKTTIDSLYHQYEVKGGDALDQRKQLIEKKSSIQAELLSIDDSLSTIAASELPLALVSDLVGIIKLQAEDEHNEYIMQQAIEQIREMLNDFSSEYTEFADGGIQFFEYINKQVNGYTNDSIYELSDQALFQVNELVEGKLENSKNSVKTILRQRNELRDKLNEINSYLQVDINENDLQRLRNKIQKNDEKRVALEVKLAKLQNDRSKINAIVISTTADYNKRVEAFLQETELQDDTDRFIRYSSLAIKILDLYSVELQKRKTDELAKTITECYKQLANKQNMISSIIMNSNTLDLIYLDADNKAVDKDSLSAGEKQLMVISILWALAICSKKSLPVIIDTPLSRMDSQHRKNLTSIYFPQASEQTIILSTDSEIDEHYYNIMKENIGDEFTLQYSESEKSTQITKGYFLGEL